MDEDWRILLIEDNEVLADQTASSIERRPVGDGDQRASVDVANGFDEGLRKLASARYDLVILDIRDEAVAAHEPAASDGDEATSADVGIKLYEELRRHRAVPIIFFTAVANLVADQERPPFVTVVSKLDPNEDALRIAVSAAIDSRLPALNRALTEYTEEVLRTYLQHFVEQHWLELSQPDRAGDLAHLLARRLARSFEDGSGLAQQLASLPGPTTPTAEPARVHPMRMYIVPPVGNWTTGDVLYGYLDIPEEQNSDQECTGAQISATSDTLLPPRYWLMLTPACDLVAGRVKADYVLLAACTLLAEEAEARNWVETRTASSEKKIDALLVNNRRDAQADRYHALPPAWDIPGLVADFQQVTHVPYAQLTNMKRVATLDEPYAQAVVGQFMRYLGRFGTPEMDLSVVRERLAQP